MLLQSKDLGKICQFELDGVPDSLYYFWKLMSIHVHEKNVDNNWHLKGAVFVVNHWGHFFPLLFCTRLWDENTTFASSWNALKILFLKVLFGLNDRLQMTQTMQKLTLILLVSAWLFQTILFYFFLISFCLFAKILFVLILIIHPNLHMKLLVHVRSPKGLKT